MVLIACTVLLHVGNWAIVRRLNHKCGFQALKCTNLFLDLQDELANPKKSTRTKSLKRAKALNKLVLLGKGD